MEIGDNRDIVTSVGFSQAQSGDDFMWLLLAQGGETVEQLESKLPPDFSFKEPGFWDSFWMMASGWTGGVYFLFLIWMVVYCLRNDPDRHIWLFILFLIQPLGPFLYFFFRWLPSSELQPPAFAQRWTRGRELQRLETAALQIGNAHQYVQYGEALKSVGQTERALTAFLQALEKEPQNLAALWGAAAMEFKAQRYESAGSKLRAILDVDESYKFGDVSLLYGKTLEALGEDEQARVHFETHTRKWRQPEAMYRLANLYEQHQQFDRARDTLQSLILDVDASPNSIARKHLFWKSRAKKQLRKLPNH